MSDQAPGRSHGRGPDDPGRTSSDAGQSQWGPGFAGDQQELLARGAGLAEARDLRPLIGTLLVHAILAGAVRDGAPTIDDDGRRGRDDLDRRRRGRRSTASGGRVASGGAAGRRSGRGDAGGGRRARARRRRSRGSSGTSGSITPARARSRQVTIEEAELYVARLEVPDDGFVVGAHLARGFGGKRDDVALAAVFRFRYDPARDDDGRAVRSTVEQHFDLVR